MRALGVGEERVAGVGDVVGGALREAGDRLDAGGDEDVALAGLDRVEGHPGGLHRRRAVAGDRRAGDRRGRGARRRRAPCCCPTRRRAGRSRGSRSSIVVGSRSGTLSSAAWTARTVRSSGRKSLSEPLLARPMGERAAETITASGMENSGCSAVARSRRTLVRHPVSGCAGLGPSPDSSCSTLALTKARRRRWAEQERREQDAVERRDERLGRGARAPCPLSASTPRHGARRGRRATA